MTDFDSNSNYILLTKRYEVTCQPKNAIKSINRFQYHNKIGLYDNVYDIFCLICKCNAIVNLDLFF